MEENKPVTASTNFGTDGESVAWSSSGYALAGAWASGWQPMSTAPKDGTVIEVMNTYGVMPWYTLARWVEPKQGEHALAYIGTDGKSYVMAPSCGNPCWGWQLYDKINGLGWSGFHGGEHLQWRPYNGKAPEEYVDPTGGMQETVNYWRSGCTNAPPIRGNPTLKEWASELEGGIVDSIVRNPSRWWLTIGLMWAGMLLLIAVMGAR